MASAAALASSCMVDAVGVGVARDPRRERGAAGSIAHKRKANACVDGGWMKCVQRVLRECAREGNEMKRGESMA